MAPDTSRLDDPRRQAPDPDGWRPDAARRRADAERNIAAILEAGLVCFSRNPDASVARSPGPPGSAESPPPGRPAGHLTHRTSEPDPKRNTGVLSVSGTRCSGR